MDKSFSVLKGETPGPIRELENCEYPTGMGFQILIIALIILVLANRCPVLENWGSHA
jgi:hypothetical protein